MEWGSLLFLMAESTRLPAAVGQYVFTEGAGEPFLVGAPDSEGNGRPTSAGFGPVLAARPLEALPRAKTVVRAKHTGRLRGNVKTASFEHRRKSAPAK